MKTNDYEQNFLNIAILLDDMTNSNGVITQLAKDVVLRKDNRSTIKLCSVITKVADLGNVTFTAKAKELKDALINLYGYWQLAVIFKSETKVIEEEKTLDEYLDELNHLVGLESVKAKVNDLISFQKVRLLRKNNGLSVHKNTLHLAFTGNPGTGKTTVARIVGHIYKQIGLLSKGHFIEVSRTDLIAGYQGQTALKVKDVIEKAKGGVLFIDEAYSITENEHSDSYGRECLTELTKALEDYRDDLVVIVAGYTDPMKQFFESNPGLKSRFNTFISFEDYNSVELMDILNEMCRKDNYLIDDVLQSEMKKHLEDTVTRKEDQFANGRYVRNLFEEMIMNHARRVSKLVNPSIIDLQLLTIDDMPHHL